MIAPEELELLPPNSPELLVACKEIHDFEKNSAWRKYVPHLIKIMRKEKGVGISANQVGLDMKLCVVDVPGDRIRILINPVVAPYGQTYRVNEGCLSYPKQTFHRKRHQHVRVDAFNLKGAKFTLDTMRLPARNSTKFLLAVCIQHEYDHLMGRDVRFDT